MAVLKLAPDTNVSHRFSDVAEELCIMLPSIEGLQDKPLVALEEAVEPLISIIPDIKQKALLAKQRTKNPSDGLTSDESASIALYTMECDPYTRSLYYILNSTLRSENRKQLEPWLLYLRLILTALYRLQSMRLTVYRSLKLDPTVEMERYQEGKDVFWWGFSSCTMNKNVSQKGHFLTSTGIRVLFIIECLHGKYVGEHSYHQNDQEVILSPGIQLEVVRCDRRQDDLHKIYLKEVESQSVLLQSLFTTPVNQTLPNALTSTDTQATERSAIQKFFRQSFNKMFKD